MEKGKKEQKNKEELEKIKKRTEEYRIKAEELEQKSRLGEAKKKARRSNWLVRLIIGDQPKQKTTSKQKNLSLKPIGFNISILI